MLLGREADVYFTGEMMHVRFILLFGRTALTIKLMFMTIARGFGCSRGWKIRHSL